MGARSAARSVIGSVGPRRGRDTQPARNLLTRRVRLVTPILGRGFGVAYLARRGAGGAAMANARGHGVSDEIFVYGCGLNVRRDDDGVLP